MDQPRAALVQGFFVAEGGAEACAIVFARILPGAHVCTNFLRSVAAA